MLEIPVPTARPASAAVAVSGELPMSAGAPRFESIQVLRFLAAFAVCVGHALLFTSQKFAVSADWVEVVEWAGGWSVTLFFCISGFVITHGAQNLTATQFLVHRLARIYPAYWLAVVAVCALKLVVFGGLPLSEMSLLSATLFPVGQRPYPLWIEWSLIYEVFFYVLFGRLDRALQPDCRRRDVGLACHDCRLRAVPSGLGE